MDTLIKKIIEFVLIGRSSSSSSPIKEIKDSSNNCVKWDIIDNELIIVNIGNPS
jgi:hypothetical protein